MGVAAARLATAQWRRQPVHRETVEESISGVLVCMHCQAPSRSWVRSHAYLGVASAALVGARVWLAGIESNGWGSRVEEHAARGCVARDVKRGQCTEHRHAGHRIRAGREEHAHDVMLRVGGSHVQSRGRPALGLHPDDGVD